MGSDYSGWWKLLGGRRRRAEIMDAATLYTGGGNQVLQVRTNLQRQSFSKRTRVCATYRFPQGITTCTFELFWTYYFQLCFQKQDTYLLFHTHYLTEIPVCLLTRSLLDNMTRNGSIVESTTVTTADGSNKNRIRRWFAGVTAGRDTAWRRVALPARRIRDG